MIQLENDGIRWEIQPGFAECLKNVLHSKAEPVKSSPVKEVSRHLVEGRVYYLKRYHHAAIPLRSFKYWWQKSQARQEWELSQALVARGVPAVQHLALGERRTWRGVLESVLITEGFEGRTLEETPGANPHAVLRFIQQMHDAGVLQRDLHPGNILVRLEPWEIRLVDLHGIVLRPTLTPAERDENLARLCVSFPLPVSEAIRQRGRALRRRLWHERSRRSLRTNREFGPHRAGGLRWRVRRPAMNPEVERILSDPDHWLAGCARILKPGRSSTVGAADGLVLKRYNLRKLGNLLKDLFRESKARRSYRKAYHLELAGVPTARIVATADRRCGGLLLRSYVLMEEIPGALELGARLKQSRPLEDELVQQAGGLIGRLHGEGMTHRDLKESNLVLDSAGRIHLLDLDGLEFVDVVSEERAAADLERLRRGVEGCIPIEARQRAVFLENYCRMRGIETPPCPVHPQDSIRSL